MSVGYQKQKRAGENGIAEASSVKRSRVGLPKEQRVGAKSLVLCDLSKCTKE